MADLERRIARLEAEADIRRLKARYLNACDAKDIDTIRECFIEEAEIVFPPIGTFQGREGLINIFSQLAVAHPIIDSHQGHNAEINVIDDDNAEARWSLSFVTYHPELKTFRLLSNFYHDRYVRTPQGWRISYSRSEPRLIFDGRVTDAKGVEIENIPAPK